MVVDYISFKAKILEFIRTSQLTYGIVLTMMGY